MIKKFLGETVHKVCKKHFDEMQKSENFTLRELDDSKLESLLDLCRKEMAKILNDFNLDLPPTKIGNPIHEMMEALFLEIYDDQFHRILEKNIRYTLINVAADYVHLKQTEVV